MILAHLIMVRGGDKNDRALARNVEGAPRPHLPKEYIGDNPPEDKCSIINEVRGLRMFYSSHDIRKGRGPSRRKERADGRGRSGEEGIDVDDLLWAPALPGPSPSRSRPRQTSNSAAHLMQERIQ